MSHIGQIENHLSHTASVGTVVDAHATYLPTPERNISIETIMRKILDTLKEQYRSAAVQPEALAFVLHCGTGENAGTFVPSDDFYQAINNLIKMKRIRYFTGSTIGLDTTNAHNASEIRDIHRDWMVANKRRQHG